jgi:hypothetical protein
MLSLLFDLPPPALWPVRHCAQRSMSTDNNSALMFLPFRTCDTDLLQDQTLLLKRSIQITGDLSLVMKLGRKGSKSQVIVINVHPHDIDLVPEYFISVAWSYFLDGIEVSKIPVRLHIQTVNTL